MIENRRLYPRFKFDAPVAYRLPQRELSSGALGRDISLGGVKMTVNDFMPLGTMLEMGLSLPNVSGQVVVRGKVVWIRENAFSERFDIGVEFTVDESMKGALDSFLKKQ